MTQLAQQILTEVQDLPPDNQREILDFVRKLKIKGFYKKKTGKNPSRFAGMWADLNEKEIAELEFLYQNRDKYLQMRKFDG